MHENNNNFTQQFFIESLQKTISFPTSEIVNYREKILNQAVEDKLRLLINCTYQLGEDCYFVYEKKNLIQKTIKEICELKNINGSALELAKEFVAEEDINNPFAINNYGQDGYDLILCLQSLHCLTAYDGFDYSGCD